MSLDALLPEIIAQIRAELPGLKSVEGLEMAADVSTQPPARPSAFIVPVGETYVEDQNGPGLVAVEARASVSVIIVVDASGARGRARGELMDFARQAVVALLGWTPNGLFRPMVPVSGQLMQAAPGRLAWNLVFKTSYRLRKQGA